MAFDYVKITKYISEPRLHKYEAVCGSNKQALKLYQTNLRLSQSFYSILSLLEVILRNAIDAEFKTHFNDIDWLENQRNGFMVDPRLTYTHWKTKKTVTNDYILKEVNDAIKKIKRRKSNVTHSKIIADLKFGFWVALFDNYHYSVLAGVPIRIFSNLPIGANRQLVDNKLSNIRDFRNRIYHNEPIIFSKDLAGKPFYDLSSANNVYKDIQDIFEWLNLNFTEWTKRINNIDFELKRAECVYRLYPSRKYYLYRLKLGVTHYKKKYLN